MKYMRGFSCFVLLGGMGLVLCCFSTSAYALSDDEPRFGIEPWFEPIDFVPGYGGQLNLEDIEHTELQLLPELPRFNGVPPIDIDGSLFDSYNLSTNSYGIAPSFDVTSSSGGVGSVTVVPEPTTVLLLGIGALALRKRKRS